MHPDLTGGHLEQETLYILSQQTRSRLQSGLKCQAFLGFETKRIFAKNYIKKDQNKTCV